MFKCSFCGKSNKEVDTLISGDGGFICDECVALCVTTFVDNERQKKALEIQRTSFFEFWGTDC